MNAKRRPLIAGNWKMFCGGTTGVELAMAIAPLARDAKGVDIVIAPPFTVLAACANELEASGIEVAAQNMHAKDSGAYTGEVSPTMLAESGCSWVIVGHSERRQHFGETDAHIAEKVHAAFRHNLKPIVCVGETLAERESGLALAVVARQVAAFVEHLVEHVGHGVIAYEPVWAIGTGKNAGPAEAEEVHAAIRNQLEKCAPSLGDNTRILYGGSVKPDNAAALFAAPNVDGALVGGASLDAKAFGAIARTAASATR